MLRIHHGLITMVENAKQRALVFHAIYEPKTILRQDQRPAS